jgi:hypothetical protein
MRRRRLDFATTDKHAGQRLEVRRDSCATTDGI